MDFRNVKSLTIPEGVVKKITSGGVVLWTAEEPIWTWKLSDPITSILDKKIEVPTGFDPTTWMVKLTLSAKLSELSAGNGAVYYYDKNSERQSMKIKENEKFTVTSVISDTLNVTIIDRVVMSGGFTFYYDNNYIKTSVNVTYEPTEVTLWAFEFIKQEPTSLVMVVDDLVAAGELTANGSAIGSDITLNNGIILYSKSICRTAANYNYGDKQYSAAIRIMSVDTGAMLLDITNYNTLTLIGRSSSATSPRNFRVGNQNATAQDTTSYTNYTDMKFHDPNAGDVTNAVTLAQYDLTTIKNDYGNVIKLWFSGNADICELRLE